MAPEGTGQGAETADSGRMVLTTMLSNCAEEPVEAVFKGQISKDDGDQRPIRFSQPVKLEPRQEQTVRVEVKLPPVRRWSPQGSGEQALYRLEASVEIPGPVVSDWISTSFGFRRRGLFSDLQGLRIARWLPPDALLREDTGDYEHLLRLAQEAGLNALRVGGSGMPETDRFYDLCDQRGIGVIQEFPLAEADYTNLPREPFLQAARHLIRRLRHHPCLLMWVGGYKLDLNLQGNQELLAELAGVVRQEDPSRPFYPTLASLDRPSFPSAPPVWGQLGRFLAAEKVWPLSEDWVAHGLRSADQERLQADYGAAANGPEWVCKAHLQQMVAYREQVETDPLSFCLGPFNEPWPGVSSSLVDWWGVPRPCYYVVKRLCQPQTLLAVLPRDRWLAGETFTATIFARSDRPSIVAARLLKPDQSVVMERKFELSGTGGEVSPGGIAQVGTLTWRIPFYQEDGLFLLHLIRTEPPSAEGQAAPSGSRQEALYWLSVARPPRSTPFLRVLWLGEKTPWLQAFWDHLQHRGAQVTAEADLPPLPAESSSPAGRNLTGYDVYVISSPSVASTLSVSEMQKLSEAVRNGAGLLLDGWAEVWDRSVLGPVLPLYSFSSGETTSPPAGPPSWIVPDHPILAGLDLQQMPKASGGGFFGLRPGSTALMEWSPGRPLLVEGTYGWGRVLAFLPTPDYARLLMAWSEREAFYSRALGYLGKLPHPAFRDLVQGPAVHPFGGLDQLPAVAAELAVDPQTVRVRAGQPQTLQVTVKNPTDHLVLMALLELRNLPAPLRAYFSDNAFPLGGKETRTVEVTLSLPHRAFGTLKIPCVLTGWKLEEKAVEVEVKLEG